MFAVRHLNQGIGKVRLSSFFLQKPDLMETLSANTAAQVSMELDV